MGENGGGQLGLGDSNDRLSPLEIIEGGVVDVQAKGNNSYFLKTDGTLWGMGHNNERTAKLS